LGLSFLEVPDLPFEDGIASARLLLSKCWFDATKCAAGVTSLRNYRKAFNQRLNEFTGTPVHDIHSHAADAFRYLAVSHRDPKERRASNARPLPRPQQDGWAV
jgi:phage terminase large subunit